MKKRRLLALILALVLLAGCAPAAEAPSPTPSPAAVSASPSPEPTPAPTPEPVTVDFREFLDGVNAARKAVIAQPEPIEIPSAYTPDFYEQNHTFTEAEMKVLTTKHEPEENLAREDLITDAETFFTLLQTTYGAYHYFGGDETFLPLLDAVKEDLADVEAPTVDTLEEILFRHLSPVLVDGHFYVGSHFMSWPHQLYMYCVPDLYLDSVEGVENPDYIKPTIGPDGRICWWYAALSHDGTDLPDTLDGNPLAWKRASRLSTNPSARIFSTSEWNGIPILISRSMSSFDSGHEIQVRLEALEELASCGGDYTDSPLLIFDVRGNGGGRGEYIDSWFHDWSGGKGQMRGGYVFRYSQLFCRLHPSGFFPPEHMGTYRAADFETSSSFTGAWAERSGPVFVLQDKGTASAGEAAVLRFHAAADALTVGGPTGGCLFTANNIDLYLPHSGLHCSIGTGLIFNETNENQDSVGYLPDLWVEPTHAMALVKKLIEYYGLNPEQ